MLRLNRLHVFGWRRKSITRDNLGNPCTTPDRRGIKTIRGHLKNAPHGQEPAARHLRPKRYLAQLLANNAIDTVVLRQSLVKEGEIRVNQAAHRQVFLNEMIEERLDLQWQIAVQQIVVQRIQLQRRRHLVEFPQVEPLIAKRMNHARTAWILQQPVDLCGQRFALQLIVLGHMQQFRIRHGQPQHTRQSRRLGVRPVGVLARGHEESRRAEHRLQTQPRRRHKVTLLFQHREAGVVIWPQLRLRKVRGKCPFGKPPDHLFQGRFRFCAHRHPQLGVRYQQRRHHIQLADGRQRTPINRKRIGHQKLDEPLGGRLGKHNRLFIRQPNFQCTGLHWLAPRLAVIGKINRIRLHLPVAIAARPRGVRQPVDGFALRIFQHHKVWRLGKRRLEARVPKGPV